MNRLWGGTRTTSRGTTEHSADIPADEPSTEPAHAAEDSPEADAERSASDTAERGVGDDEDDAPEAAAVPERTGLTAGRRRVGLLVLAVVLLVAGAGFLYEAHQLRSTPSAGNRALTDVEATNRVAGDVDNALARIFSYTPEGTDATEKSARSVLTGRAARQYGELFDRVRSDLAGQEVGLTTVAVRTGVVELRGGTAKLLVFLDQNSRRGNAKESYAAAQLSVTARFENDRWRIADIQTR